MISAVLTLFVLVISVSNPAAAWGDSAAGTPDETALSAETQCKSAELTFDEITRTQPTREATNRVYCQFRVFCPAEHRCCQTKGIFWCCPEPATCDSNMDADDWTGCHGAHGVNPL